MQTPRQNVVHSILTQPLHIAGQMPGQLPQIQMALAQVLPNQNEAQTQVLTNTQNTPPQVLVSTSSIALHIYIEPVYRRAYNSLSAAIEYQC
jgi:hypothetical protein